jgi:hypothetical protein
MATFFELISIFLIKGKKNFLIRRNEINQHFTYGTGVLIVCAKDCHFFFLSIERDIASQIVVTAKVNISFAVLDGKAVFPNHIIRCSFIENTNLLQNRKYIICNCIINCWVELSAEERYEERLKHEKPLFLSISHFVEASIRIGFVKGFQFFYKIINVFWLFSLT